MQSIYSPVIPVLDLIIGQVVWARGGSRDQYRPVQSRLTNSSQPLDVAHAIFNQTGCDWLYVADIDSFAGANPNWSIFERLTQAGFKLLIDADWLSPKRFDEAIGKLNSRSDIKPIISTETIDGWDQINRLERFRQASIDCVFSLDMRGEQVIGKSAEISQADPLTLAQRALDQGVGYLICLDLKTVGTYAGAQPDQAPQKQSPDQPYSRLDFIRKLSTLSTEAKIISGGGVRGVDDCRLLLAAGCQHVLVASAIYDCQITPDEIIDLVF